ncbi:hypothetical protein MCEMRE196_00528 [Candidatus Nanopelagicaceae bacterium]
MFKSVVSAIALSLLLPASAHAAVTSSGSNGASISIPQSKFTKETKIIVSGRNFDETVGIYLAYCVVPKKGTLPSPCGGGVNKNGTGEASYWISSNPPPYGVGLAIPFAPGGRFKESVAITRKIGKYDCRKVKCAITVRSDHLHEGDRSHDIYIPISIK